MHIYHVQPCVVLLEILTYLLKVGRRSLGASAWTSSMASLRRAYPAGNTRSPICLAVERQAGEEWAGRTVELHGGGRLP